MSKPKRVHQDSEGVDRQAPFPEDILTSVSRAEETTPDATLSGGDVDAARTGTDAGEETVGGSTPTPDQDLVDELGKAAGVTYEDGEPLQFGDKVASRDAQRWELNPASSEGYQERVRELSSEASTERASTAEKGTARRGTQKRAPRIPDTRGVKDTKSKKLK